MSGAGRCAWWAYPLGHDEVTPEARRIRARVAYLRGRQIWAGRALRHSLGELVRRGERCGRVLLGDEHRADYACHDQVLITPMLGERGAVAWVENWLNESAGRSLVVDVTADVWRLGTGIPEVTADGEFRGLDGHGDTAAWWYWSSHTRIRTLDQLLGRADVITTPYESLTGVLPKLTGVTTVHVPDAVGRRGRRAHRVGVNTMLAVAQARTKTRTDAYEKR